MKCLVPGCRGRSASMGPPHDGGGEYGRDRWQEVWNDMLQWGRLTMEAESRANTQYASWHGYASMGPPHDGGGE